MLLSLPTRRRQGYRPRPFSTRCEVKSEINISESKSRTIIYDKVGKGRDTSYRVSGVAVVVELGDGRARFRATGPGRRPAAPDVREGVRLS